jgi:hypothetical protein
MTPATLIRILRNVPLDNTYRDTLTWAGATTSIQKAAQAAYFNGKAKYTYPGDAFTYQKVEKRIRIDQNAEDLWDCNYVMFQNSNFGTRWFYAFITNVEYKSNDMCYVSFEIDVMQTWYFDYTLNRSFIERQHVDNDAIGANLIPEGLETGDFKCGAMSMITEIQHMAIVVCSTSDGTNTYVGTMYTGIFSGVAMFAWDENDYADVDTFLINNLNSAGKGNAISSIFMMPRNLIDFDANTHLVSNLAVNVIPKTYTKNHSSLDGYVPHNNKMFIHPYNFLSVTNFCGVQATFKYEYATNSTMEFFITSNVAPNPTVFLVPENYNNVNMNYSEALRLKGYPLCQWTFGAYANWLAQNAVSLPLSVMGSALSLGVGAVTGNPIGIASGILGVANSLGEIYKHSVEPDHARGAQTDGANVALDIQTFAFIPMTIRAEFAAKIDKYFDLYGYKVNAIDIPSVTGRASWNYVKTIGVCITGSVPFNHLEVIKANYNKGITFWHGDYVGDYSRSNAIV